MRRVVGVVAFFGIASLALVVALVVGNWMPAKPAPRPPDLRVVALAESLATARAEARANLEAWAKALEHRDTVVRVVVRYVARHDTAWLHHVADSGKMIDTVELVRWLAVSDSSQRVRGDSLAGELVQCRYDADQCSEALQARPESCGTWSAFGIGFGAGFSAAAAGCAVLR
jgi:hypothetical protein